MEEKDFEKFKDSYNKGELLISVDLSKARQVLMQMGYKPVIYFYFVMLALLLLCCVFSFFTFKWFGILYSIAYITIWVSSLGSFSLPQSNKVGKNIIITGIIFLIISLLFSDITLTFLVIISFIELYLAYYFYRFSAKRFIEDFILKDVKYFNMFINDVFFVKQNNIDQN